MMPSYIQDPELLAQLNAGAPARGADAFDQAVRAEGLSGPIVDVARSIYQQESGGGRNTKTSNAGAVGGMQILPATFASVADKGWDINDPVANARAGLRYVKQGYEASGGDPALTGAFYYGGPGGLAKAKQGQAVRDPRNPNAPDTLQYGQQVASRIPKERGLIQRAVEAVIPSAQAAERQYIEDPALLQQLNGDGAPAAPQNEPYRVEVRGTSADEPQVQTRTDRVAQGLVDPINGGAQLLERGVRALAPGLVQGINRVNNAIADSTGLVARLPEGGVDQQVRDQEVQYQAARREVNGGQAPGFDGYRLLGNILSPANLALGASAPAAATAAGRVGAAAATAGAAGALTPVVGGDPENFAVDKAKQVGISTVAGGLFQPIVAGVGRLISPNASTNPQNALLAAEGVRPTIGQTLGGVANRVEQRLTSVPFMGDSIAGARASAQEDLRRAVQNRVTDPINGQRVAETGQAGAAAVGRQVDDAYEAARNAMGSFQLDSTARQEFTALRQQLSALDPKAQKQFAAAIAPLRQDISQNGTISADVFKRVDSKLGQEAVRFSKSTDGYQQQLGDALAEMQRIIRDAGSRADPKAGQMFKQANAAFANQERLREAAKAAVRQEGEFTPGQLAGAVRSADQSVRKNNVATGNALMQDLGNAGLRLSNTVPNSGTVDRAMQIVTGGAVFADPVITGSLLAAGSTMYSPAGQSLLRTLATARPEQAQAVRNALLQASPALAPAAGQAALGFGR